MQLATLFQVNHETAANFNELSTTHIQIQTFDMISSGCFTRALHLVRTKVKLHSQLVYVEKSGPQDIHKVWSNR